MSLAGHHYLMNEYALRGTGWFPTDVWAALFHARSVTNARGTGNTYASVDAAEVNEAGYERVRLDKSKWIFNPPDRTDFAVIHPYPNHKDYCFYDHTIRWPVAESYWGDDLIVALCDAATGGTLLCWLNGWLVCGKGEQVTICKPSLLAVKGETKESSNPYHYARHMLGISPIPSVHGLISYYRMSPTEGAVAVIPLASSAWAWEYDGTFAFRGTTGGPSSGPHNGYRIDGPLLLPLVASDLITPGIHIYLEDGTPWGAPVGNHPSLPATCEMTGISVRIGIEQQGLPSFRWRII